MENPKVSICAITYNHAPYIKDCLDGFLMQKTNFPFEIIINDDCSTDGTTDIIKDYTTRYPNIIKPIFHSENQYQKGIRGMFNTFVYPKANGKYIALCEGDDYWTDPYKLQKQVDFLESHPDYSMCFTNAIIHYEYGNFLDKEMVEINTPDITPLSLYQRWQVPTASMLIRKEVFHTKIYIKSMNIQKAAFGDVQIAIAAGFHGKIRYINEYTTVYRKISSGASFSIAKNAWPHIRTRIMLSKIYGKDYIKADKKYCSLYFIRALKKPFDFFPNNLYIILKLLYFAPIESLKQLKWIYYSICGKFK